MRLFVTVPKGLNLEGVLDSAIALYEEKFRQIEIVRIDLELNQRQLFETDLGLGDEHLEAGLNKALELVKASYSIEGWGQVVVLTDRFNQRGIIAGPSQQQKGISFLCINHPISNILASPQIPIAYELAVAVLRSRVYWSEDIMSDFIHQNETLGCVNDFCQDIKQMELKIKTGDICASCMSKLIDSSFPRSILDDILNALESIRRALHKLSQLVAWEDVPEVILRESKLLIPSEGIEVHFKPIEFVLYSLYADNVEGLKENQVHEHEQWVNNLYGEISKTEGAWQESVRRLCAPESARRNSVRSDINRILKRRLPHHLAMLLSITKEGNPAVHRINTANHLKLERL